MKNVKLTALVTLTTIMSGCASMYPTAQETKAKLLKTGMTHEKVVNADYITAYSRLKPFYLRCVARKGVSYPITAGGVTTTQKTADTNVYPVLQRKNKLAIIDTHSGALATQSLTIAPVSAKKSTIKVVFMKKGLLQTQSGYDKSVRKTLENITKFAEGRNESHCR